jgi:YidC/Oxa1 family membrane protein insertase
LSFGDIWNLIILSPLINAFIMVSHYLFNSFGLTIIVFTILIRAAMYPLTRRQLRATKAMQSIQAQVAELQKKYAKDKQKLAQEQIKLYKQTGMNPLGCLLPMLIQFPVWIALYQSILRVLAVVPEDFLSLSKHLYTSWPMVFSQVPLESHFLWLDLATSDAMLILPILVAASQWVQQKMTTLPSADPKQQSQSQMMLWMMPIMFFFFSISFPSGLALYWLAGNIISIVMQYFVTGWGGLTLPRFGGGGKKVASVKQTKEPVAQLPAGPAVTEPKPAREEGLEHGKSGDAREDRGGSRPTGPPPIRRKQGRGRSQNRKRR